MTDVYLHTNDGYPPGDVLLRTSAPTITAPGGSALLPRLRQPQRLTGAGHLHIVLTGEGRLRSHGHLLIALSGTPGHLGEHDWEAVALALGWEDLL